MTMDGGIGSKTTGAEHETATCPGGMASSGPTTTTSPESQKVTALKSSVESVVKKLTSKNKYWDCVKEPYHKVYKCDNAKVLALYKSMMEQLEGMMRDEFFDHCSSNNVFQRLADLDALSPASTSYTNDAAESPSPATSSASGSDAKTAAAWRPSGDPALDLEDHLRSPMEKEVRCLRKLLASLQRNNKVLNESCRAEDEKLRKSLLRLQTTATAWDGAAAAIAPDARSSLEDYLGRDDN